MITVVDYGAGNVRSVVNMLGALSIASTVTADPEIVNKAERLILPGVGHFQHGVAALRETGVAPVLAERVMEARIPILGICLGAQLMLDGSEESDAAGLGWIPGNSVRFDARRLGPSLRVPHMGWADTAAICDLPPFTPLAADARFYFVHSFHFACAEASDIFLTARHGETFTAGFARRNIIGVQFHPEKSHRFGLGFLRAFSLWQPGPV